MKEEGFFSKFRMKYFGCERGGEHDGQVLNYVCVDKKCNKVGLLCSICKQQHENHLMYPLKLLLKKLQKNSKGPLQSSQGFQTPLHQLQQEHKLMLFSLKRFVQKLSERIMNLEQHINKQYSKAKIQLLEQVQMNMKLNTFLTEALDNKIKNRISFLNDMERVAIMVNVNPQSKQIYYQTELQKISDGFKHMREKIQSKFTLFEEFLNKQEIIIPYSMSKPSQNPVLLSNYTFSQQCKASTIQISKKGKCAKKTKTGDERFILVNQNVGIQKQKIAFKITNLKNWIAVGICIKNKVKSLNYRFQYNNLGHGSYLISSNGYTWSHSQKQKNIATSDFKYVTGDIIDIDLNGSLMTFTNRSTKETKSLDVSKEKSQMEQFCFTANLCTAEDSVEILDNV